MNAFVKLISKIGIFMIAGQAVIHFAPAEKYAKYMKLIVGLMILLQFLSPIYKLVGGSEEEWSRRLTNMGAELNDGLFVGAAEKGEWGGEFLNDQIAEKDPLNISIITNMEKEIKTRLNGELSDENYSVIKVSVDIDNNELKMVHTAVRVYDTYEKHENVYTETEYPETGNDADYNDTDNNRVVKVEKVSVQKITTDEDYVKDSYDKQELGSRLRERFCKVLGIDEEYMEVSIYGAVE